MLKMLVSPDDDALDLPTLWYFFLPNCDVFAILATNKGVKNNKEGLNKEQTNTGFVCFLLFFLVYFKYILFSCGKATCTYNRKLLMDVKTLSDLCNLHADLLWSEALICLLPHGFHKISVRP